MGSAVGSIDAIEILSVNGVETPEVGDVLAVRGWAHQRDARASFALVIDGGAEYAIGERFPRPDVVAALKDPSAADAGFALSIPTIDLAPGEHSVAIVATGTAGRTEVARTVFAISASNSLAGAPAGRGCVDYVVDEAGRRRLIPDRQTTVRVKGSEVVRFDGWAADTVTGTGALAAFALVGEHVIEAAYGFERLDVGREIGEPHAYSGYSVSLPGAYASRTGTPFRIIVLAGDGRTLRPCEPLLTLIGE